MSQWLFQRQTLELQEEEVTLKYSDEGSEAEEADADIEAQQRDSPAAERVHVPDLISETSNAYENIEPFQANLQYAAFNGRCNKIGDTCYAFWVGGTLDASLLPPLPSLPESSYCLQMINQTSLINHTANRKYLLEKTQHRIGGFGKLPGDPPGMLATHLKCLA